MSDYRVDKRLYLTEDGSRIVTGPPESYTFFRARGQRVSQEEIDKWGAQLTRHVPDYEPPKPKAKAKKKETSGEAFWEPQPAEIEEADNG